MPSWGSYLEQLGQRVAGFSTVEYGERSLRIILSVPTGRLAYWLLASGAFAEQPDHSSKFSVGDRVACRVDNRMQDVELVEKAPEIWQLSGTTSIMKDRFIAAGVPDRTPDDRRSARLAVDVKDRLRAVPGHEHDFWIWYARHSLKPVVIVGTGREHIQDQRRIVLEQTPHWFSKDTRALLTEDTAMTSKPERMLFHPFMVFDADVGASRPWLRQMVPRVVITTSWSSHLRIHPALWSRAPQIIVTNRRVRSASDAEMESLGSGETHEFDEIIHDGRPPSIGARAFLVTAQGEAFGDIDDDEELM